MKKIEAFVKPFTLEAIKAALAEADVEVFRILQAQELSSVRTHAEVYRGTEYEMDVAPRVLIVVLVEDERTDAMIRLIQEAGQTDHPGDGRIIVTSVEQLVHIDEGELELQE